jgi:hypothetical protein
MTAPNLILKHFFPPPDININLYILNPRVKWMILMHDPEDCSVIAHEAVG